MKTKSKQMIMLAALCSFIIVGLVFINGCKKSEPPTSSTTEMSGNDMSNMTMTNHDGMNMSSDTVMEAMPNGQKICPVMGQPVDPNVFVEYEGKKVYFCCEDCKAQFQENPEKYIAELPQFEK